jgi:hypothetical protein
MREREIPKKLQEWGEELLVLAWQPYWRLTLLFRAKRGICCF